MERGQEGPLSSPTRLGDKEEVKLVSTELGLQQMLMELNKSNPSVIAVDAEGHALSRDGTLSLLAMCWDESLIYIVDVQELGSRSFSQVVEDSGGDTKCSSVKQILEDSTTVKVFCDPRSDSDALYHHYGIILLKNVFCVQLAEVGIRRVAGHKVRFVKGGKKITQEFGELSWMERTELERIDREAGAMFFPDRGQGGSYDNLTRRPLISLALKYSALGVCYLYQLYEKLGGQLPARGIEWVKDESRKRVEEYLLPTFKRGKERAEAPPHWAIINSLPQRSSYNFASSYNYASGYCEEDDYSCGWDDFYEYGDQDSDGPLDCYP